MDDKLVPMPEARSRSSFHSSRTKSSRRKRPLSPAQDSYTLAYPAPVFTNKAPLVKHLRPRLYLQLQRISGDRLHHAPAIDVISPALTLTGYQRTVAALKTCTQHLSCGLHHMPFHHRDILVVDYGQDSPFLPQHHVISKPEVSSCDGADLGYAVESSVVAVLRANNAIATRSGQVWHASERANKSFEFVTVDAHGVRSVARWVVAKHHRHSHSSRRSHDRPSSPPSSPVAVNETCLHFSLLDPAVRRHAVLATLTPSGLDVRDTYLKPRSELESVSEEEESQVHAVDDATKALILATGVWLILHLGWSPVYEVNRQRPRGVLSKENPDVKTETRDNSLRRNSRDIWGRKHGGH